MRHLTTLFFGLFFHFLIGQKVAPVVQFGHIGKSITGMTYSSDGTMMATTDGQYVKLWEVASGLEFRAFSNEAAAMRGISHITFSPDDNQIIYLADRKILFHSINTGEIENELSIQTEAEKSLEEGNEPTQEDFQELINADKYQGIAFSKDGTLLVVATDSEITVFAHPSGQVIKKIKLKKKEEESPNFFIDIMLSRLGKPMRIDPTNRYVFFNGKVFDISSGKEKFDWLKNHEKLFLTTADFSVNGKFLTMGGIIVDTTMTNNSNNNFLRIMEQLSGSTAGEVLLTYNTQSGDLVNSINDEGVFSIDYHPTKLHFITGHHGNQIKIWDATTGKNILNHTVAADIEEEPKETNNFFANMMKNAPVGAAIFTPDGNHFVARGDVKKLESLVIWDTQTGEKIQNLGANIPPIKLEGENAMRDSLVLREYEEIYQMTMNYPKKFFKGFRLLDLTTGKVPSALARFDSIVFSPLGNHYLVKTDLEPLAIYESELNDKLCELEGGHGGYSKLVFNEMGTKVAGRFGNTFRVWNASTGEVFMEKNEHTETVSFLGFDLSGEYLVSISKKERKAKFWSLETQKEVSELKKFYISDEAIKNTKKVFNIINEVKNTSILDRVTRKKAEPEDESEASKILNITTFFNPKGFYDVDFSPDGKIAAVWAENRYSVKFINVESGEDLRNYRDNKSMLINKFLLRSFSQEQLKEREEAEDDMEEEASDSTEYAFYGGSNPMEMMIQQMKEQYTLKNFTAISPDFEFFAVATKHLNNDKENHISILPVVDSKKNGKEIKVKFLGQRKRNKRNAIKLKESNDYQEGLTFSPNSQFVAASSRSNNAIRIWNTETGEIHKTLKGHSGKIAFGPKSETLISSGWDRQVKVWDIENNKALYTFIGIQGSNDYIIMLPSGEYTTSRKNSKAIAFRKGRKAYPFEQFDLLFQRPDQVLRRMGENRKRSTDKNENEVLATAYENAYNKRLEKLGFSKEDFNNDFQLPEVTVTKLPLSSKSKNIVLKINAKDKEYQLSTLHVYVNDVPVFGQAGKSLRANGKKHYSNNIEVKLSNGDNKIQVSVLNSKAVESLKSTHQVKYTGTAAPVNKYVILLGSNMFTNDESLNLKYPEIDLKKVGDVFQQKDSKIKLHDLTGTKFNLTEFAKLESTLKNTKVDDEVIIFIATHGILDNQLNYYLATNDVDFNSPKQKGLSYDRLEDLLDKMPARKKVVFIDACHAGEVDETDITAAENQQNLDGEIKFRQFRSTGWNQMGIQNSFDLMKSLFVDLRRGTGATIIASAGGVEAAMESAEWNNSVFMYGFLRGLREGLADLNNDGMVTISELQFYLPKMVKRLTKNLQQPTYRMENLEEDWKIW